MPLRPTAAAICLQARLMELMTVASSVSMWPWRSCCKLFQGDKGGQQKEGGESRRVMWCDTRRGICICMQEGGNAIARGASQQPGRAVRSTKCCWFDAAAAACVRHGRGRAVFRATGATATGCVCAREIAPAAARWSGCTAQSRSSCRRRRLGLLPGQLLPAAGRENRRQLRVLLVGSLLLLLLHWGACTDVPVPSRSAEQLAAGKQRWRWHSAGTHTKLAERDSGGVPWANPS